jgi:PP-loop superfamily ATP-utilizing enzyme
MTPKGRGEIEVATADDGLRTAGALFDQKAPMVRVLAQFSCGAASACAWKLAVERYGDSVVAVNAFIADEDEDNRRFLADCERWIGRPVTVLRDEKYGASPAQVWRKKRFLVNRNGAPCSKALKRDVLNAFYRPGDLLVLGYTADPRDAARLDRFIDANVETRVWAPLIEAGMTKDDCFRMVAAAGIELPRMYRLGYPNANCPKCVKGGMGYWNKIRITHPENFEEVASIQDVLGPGSYFFRDRKTGDRISLRNLDPDAGRFEPIELPDCGAVCEMPDSLAQSAPPPITPEA